MIKILAVATYLFILLCLLLALWGQLQRIQNILERGIWQHDQHLKKMNDIIINSFDKQNEIIINVFDKQNEILQNAVNTMKGE